MSLVVAHAAFAAAHPEERVAVGGRDWGVLRIGSGGPALVLLPGTLGRADIFWQQIEALEGRARILALSYPATGGLTDWCADIAALIGRAGMDRATVLGSSLGGYVAQAMAGWHADRVEGLIAANTLHSVRPIQVIPPYALDLDAAPVEDLRAGFFRALQARAGTHPAEAGLIDLLKAEAGGRIPEAELRARLRTLKQAPELPAPRIAADRIATVESDDDPLIPPPMRDAVRARLSPARAFRFVWGGHFPYVVRPDAYTAAIEGRLGLPGTDWPEGDAQ